MAERVAVLLPGGLLDAADLTALAEHADVVLVCRAGAATAGWDALEVPIRQPHGVVQAAIRAANGSPLGRTLLRLTPWDPGASFWRALSSQARLEERLRGASLVVAGERDAIYAAWRILRAPRWGIRRGVNGIAAAREAVGA